MDKQINKRRIEHIKSILLVVLFLSTILLLYFFWGSAVLEDFARNGNTVENEVLEARDVVKPTRIVVCYEPDTYVILDAYDDKAFGGMRDCFADFSKDRNLVVEEIEKVQYDEIMKSVSISVQFDYYIPFSGFCEKFDIAKISGTDAIDVLSEIGYSDRNKESLFVCDKKNNKYYRFYGSAQEEPFLNLSKMIAKAADGQNTTYYTLGYTLGSEISNQTLIPVSLSSNLKDFEYMQEFYPAQDEKVSQIARSFFGNSFDFVRKIEEKNNGTVIYMYGYGEIVLSANPNGTFEYKHEDANKPLSQDKYFDALDKALRFIAIPGSFETLDGISLAPYLKDVIVDPNGKKGYEFVFGVRIGEGSLYYQSGNPMIVDVISGGVNYYKRDFIGFDAEEQQEAVSTEKEAFSAINMLAQNYEYINEILVNIGGDSLSVDRKSAFEDIATKIDNLTYGYVRVEDEDKNPMIKAAWIVHIPGVELYFGLYDAEPLGYTQK